MGRRSEKKPEGNKIALKKKSAEKRVAIKSGALSESETKLIISRSQEMKRRSEIGEIKSLQYAGRNDVKTDGIMRGREKHFFKTGGNWKRLSPCIERRRPIFACVMIQLK